jgi:hypothetical protein
LSRVHQEISDEVLESQSGRRLEIRRFGNMVFARSTVSVIALCLIFWGLNNVSIMPTFHFVGLFTRSSI